MSIVSSKIKAIRNQRLEEIKKRKNFLPALILTIFLWFGLVCTILFVDPFVKGAVELFLGMFFAASLFTFSLILGHKRRGLLVATALTLFLILRYVGVGTIINLLLIIGAAVLFEFYFSERKK